MAKEKPSLKKRFVNASAALPEGLFVKRTLKNCPWHAWCQIKEKKQTTKYLVLQSLEFVSPQNCENQIFFSTLAFYERKVCETWIRPLWEPKSIQYPWAVCPEQKLLHVIACWALLQLTEKHKILETTSMSDSVFVWRLCCPSSFHQMKNFFSPHTWSVTG